MLYHYQTTISLPSKMYACTNQDFICSYNLVDSTNVTLYCLSMHTLNHEDFTNSFYDDVTSVIHENQTSGMKYIVAQMGNIGLNTRLDVAVIVKHGTKSPCRPSVCDCQRNLNTIHHGHFHNPNRTATPIHTVFFIS